MRELGPSPLFVWLLTGCQAAGPVMGDGGPAADAGEVVGDFEVSVARRGEVLDDGAMLPVDFGCQGGAHVEVDVQAIDDGPMRDATVRVEVLGGPRPASVTLGMNETPRGAELVAVLAPFGDFMTFVDPSQFDFPIAATLRVTVTSARGTVVTLERAVSLAMGSTCTCTYSEPLPGAARLDAFTVTGEASGCEPVQIALDLTFTPDDPDQHVFYPFPTTHAFAWPARCVDALGLAVGAELRLDYRDSFPGQPCAPPSYYEGPARDSMTCDCPIEP